MWGINHESQDGSNMTKLLCSSLIMVFMAFFVDQCIVADRQVLWKVCCKHSALKNLGPPVAMMWQKLVLNLLSTNDNICLWCPPHCNGLLYIFYQDGAWWSWHPCRSGRTGKDHHGFVVIDLGLEAKLGLGFVIHQKLYDTRLCIAEWSCSNRGWAVVSLEVSSCDRYLESKKRKK